jgi:hypothetical protein
MLRVRCLPVATVCVALVASASSLAKDDPTNLDSFLTDVTAGQISAGSLVGLTGSAIAQIQTSQDLVVALKPLAVGSSRAGYGIAITPARTTITPMSALSYHEHWYMRLVGGTTLSYAENDANVSSVAYRKSGASIDTFYYIDPDDDPVVGGYKAFAACKPERKAFIDAMVKAQENGDPAAIKTAKSNWEAFEKKCVDDFNTKVARTQWNASRISLSAGTGRISPVDGTGSSVSLGTSATLGGIIRSGSQGATYFSLRRTVHEVDLSTLGPSPSYKNSNLAALRFTYGSEDENGGLKLLGEISNAKKAGVTTSNSVFMYAVGIDKRIAKGTWIEFRLGKSTTLDGSSTQNAGLLTLDFAPSAGLFSK